MNRRRFISVVGTAVFGSTAIQTGINKPAIGLEFELTESIDTKASETDSVIIDFNKFELTPQYIDEGSKVTITITLDVENTDTVTTESEVQLQNGETMQKSSLNQSLPVVIDNINSTEALDGTIEINIDHPDVSDTYTQSFTINEYIQIQATGGDSTYKLVDQGSSVITKSELSSDESLDDYDGRKYKTHVFTSTGTQDFIVDELGDTDKIEVLIVGGGGGGGEGSGVAAAGGGGGAGGLVFRKITIQQKTYNITVGSGGLGGLQEDSPTEDGKGVNGDNSSAFSLTALGGGGGGGTGSEADGLDGGSGGGGGAKKGIKGSSKQSGSSTGGYGNDGGDGNPSNLGGSGDDPGGGGGGAGENGQSAADGVTGGDGGYAGDGGRGRDYSHVFGTTIGDDGHFAGGGGGSYPNHFEPYLDTAGLGGKGGGGDGGLDRGGDNGQQNTGGGGGGADQSIRAGDGGSGIVLIRYPLEPKQ